MNRTKIEWTHFTANPLKYRTADGKVVWGCVHASEGCRLCYSEALAKRYGRGGPFSAATMAGLTPFMDEGELRSMLTYKPASGKMCFVGDMTDIFGEWVPFELLDKLFAVFALRPDVTWQILTKRPERMREYCSSGTVRTGRNLRIIKDSDVAVWVSFPLKNVWLGCSVEDQKTADARIPLLLQTPAAIRFVSYEPALEAVSFDAIHIQVDPGFFGSPLRWHHRGRCHEMDGIEYPTLDLVICGGESGPKSRPFNVQWARSAAEQCRNSHTAFFMKQVGSTPYDGFRDDGITMNAWYLSDRKGGNPLEWTADLQVRQFPGFKEES